MFVVALIAVEAKLFNLITEDIGWGWLWLVRPLVLWPLEFGPGSSHRPGLAILGGWLVFLAVELTPIGVALLCYVLATCRGDAARGDALTRV